MFVCHSLFSNPFILALLYLYEKILDPTVHLSVSVSLSVCQSVSLCVSPPGGPFQDIQYLQALYWEIKPLRPLTHLSTLRDTQCHGHTNNTFTQSTFSLGEVELTGARELGPDFLQRSKDREDFAKLKWKFWSQKDASFSWNFTPFQEKVSLHTKMYPNKA